MKKILPRLFKCKVHTGRCNVQNCPLYDNLTTFTHNSYECPNREVDR